MPDFAPKRSLGQNFLISPGICQKIVALVRAGDSDNIIEIGPGRGALTRFLLAGPHGRLVLVEKDSSLAAARRTDGGAEVLEMDALAFDWRGLRGRWKIVGNLPYNIASPLIWDIVSGCRCYGRAVFMVQKEVAERICADPDSRKYGALSVWTQCHSRPVYEFAVPPGCFFPPPKVDSAVVVFEPLPESPPYPEKLKGLLDICFRQRRKQLGGVLRSAGIQALCAGLKELNLDPCLRPENLACKDFLALAEFWAKNQNMSVPIT